MISVIIPVYNEEDNIGPLLDMVIAALGPMARDYEIILINDGSTDNTDARLRDAAAADARVKVINFTRNYGQTAAMMAGLDHARGDIIVSLDGDLQNDAGDIPRLVSKLEEGYSVVCGWRKDRKDAALKRNLPSRIANWLISTVSGVRLHDYGCTLRAYRRETMKNVKLYGEMHRFIPIYATWNGGKICEMPVMHRARIHGVSKYGLSRTFKVVLDLLVVKFLYDYRAKPIHFFGMVGLSFIAFSFLSLAYAVFLKIFEGISLIRTPLLLLAVMTFTVGCLCILIGLVAEMVTRVYYDSHERRAYLVRDSLNLESGGNIRPGNAPIKVSA